LRDYGNTGAINANTDVTAAQYKRLAGDCAAGSLTAPIATIVLRYDNGDAYVSSVVVPWAPPLYTEYAGASPPSALYPSVAIVGSTATIALPNAATDDYGVSENVIARIATPFLSAAYWEGPTGTSSFAITCAAFSNSEGFCPIVVY
jgi:hypothetical protein